MPGLPTPDPTTTTPSATDDLLAQLGSVGLASIGARSWQHADDVPDVLSALIPAGYRTELIDVEDRLGHLRPAPRRVRGVVTVRDTASWLAYFAKHRTDGTEVFGDVDHSTVTAVLNAPTGPAAPAWGDHRVVLQLLPSPSWTAWRAIDGRWLSQDAFAEHVEARTPDLVDPDAATMLDVAQSLKATKGVEFEAASSLHNGARRFAYLETVTAKAGQRGTLDVPTQLELRLQPWRGVAIAVPVTARFRFRVTREGLHVGVVLDRIDDVLDAAWASLLGELSEGLNGLPVLAGPAPTYAGPA